MDTDLAPFWTEGPIPPALVARHFIGRADERERLAGRWSQRAPARTVLVGAPRGGKRSLVAASLADLPEGVVVPLRVPVGRLLPDNGRGFADAILGALRGRIPEGDWRAAARSLAHGPPDAPEETVLDFESLLEQVSRGRPAVIFEDAHRFRALGRGIREAIDSWAATSKAHVLSLVDHDPVELVPEMPSLFGPRGVRTMRLEGLPRRDAEAYVRDRLAAVRCQARPEALRMLLEYAGGDPASLQLLGARAHDVLLRRGRGLLEEEDVVEALGLVLEGLPHEWTRVLGGIDGRLRDVFVSLAVLDDPRVADIGRRIHLDGKNVSVILGRLAARSAPIEKIARGRWRITHRLVKEWVRKEWAVVR